MDGIAQRRKPLQRRMERLEVLSYQGGSSQNGEEPFKWGYMSYHLNSLKVVVIRII